MPMHYQGLPVHAVGKHLYANCNLCGKLVRVTGWFKGIHLCLSPYEVYAKLWNDPRLRAELGVSDLEEYMRWNYGAQWRERCS